MRAVVIGILHVQRLVPFLRSEARATLPQVLRVLAAQHSAQLATYNGNVLLKDDQVRFIQALLEPGNRPPQHWNPAGGVLVIFA